MCAVAWLQNTQNGSMELILGQVGLGINIMGIVVVETFEVSVFYRYYQKDFSDQPVFIKIIYL
jgi:hypothetical protein